METPDRIAEGQRGHRRRPVRRFADFIVGAMALGAPVGAFAGLPTGQAGVNQRDDPVDGEEVRRHLIRSDPPRRADFPTRRVMGRREFFSSR